MGSAFASTAMSVQGYILFTDEVPQVRAALDAVRTEAAARTICVRRCADVCSDRSRWMSLLSLVGNPALFAYMAPAIHVLVTSAPLSEATQGTLFAMPSTMNHQITMWKQMNRRESVSKGRE